MTTNVDSNPTAQPSTPRNLVVGILLGTVVSVFLLIPGMLNAISGSNILPSVAEAGPVVVAGIAALALLYMAITELLPAFLARVSAGAHWPTDVLGGVLLGGAWAALVIYLTDQRHTVAARIEPDATATHTA